MEGGRDGCQSEKIIAPERDAAIRVTLSPSVCRTDETSHLDGSKQLGR